MNLDEVGESDNNRVRVATSNGGHIGAAEGASIRGDGSNNLSKSGHDLEDDSGSIKLGKGSGQRRRGEIWRESSQSRES